MGDSVACSGICLTVAHVNERLLAFDLSAETLTCTTAGAWRYGQPLNLEPALRIGEPLGGHLVSGHVDNVTGLLSIHPLDGSHRLTFALPQSLRPLVAPKGSVCIDGVSLTVNTVTDSAFTVTVIPHTWQHTTLSALKAGATVNLEVDMLARYVAQILGAA
jgi:riboflavin synthase